MAKNLSGLDSADNWDGAQIDTLLGVEFDFAGLQAMIE
jgi:hypothetical protein